MKFPLQHCMKNNNLPVRVLHHNKAAPCQPHPAPTWTNKRHCKLAHQSQSQYCATFTSHILSIFPKILRITSSDNIFCIKKNCVLSMFFACSHFNNFFGTHGHIPALFNFFNLMLSALSHSQSPQHSKTYLQRLETKSETHFILWQSWGNLFHFS